MGDLPRAARTAGGSMPWSTALRMRWTRGSPISSMIALSTRVDSPCTTSSICFPCWRARSRTRRGKRSKTWRMGSIRTSMIVSWSCVDTEATWCTASSSSGPAAGAVAAICRPRSASLVRWTISSPTRFRSWSSLAKSTRTMLERAVAAAWRPRRGARRRPEPSRRRRRGGRGRERRCRCGGGRCRPGRRDRRRRTRRGRRAGRGRRGEQLGERRLLRREVALLGPRHAGRLHRVAQGRGPGEETIDRRAVEDEGAVARARHHVLEAVDVVLDVGEAHHAAVALERVQRTEEGGRRLAVVAVALEGEERAVEGVEVLAGVLEVDGDELGGDLEIHQRRPRAEGALTAT